MRRRFYEVRLRYERRSARDGTGCIRITLHGQGEVTLRMSPTDAETLGEGLIQTVREVERAAAAGELEP
ncbi:MAG TPA: hypothetical protein VNK52_16155 [Hyphomicrobiaceae bacterium]|nr:hypothetical protein [Hyphomicrobiaceae bacterium]